jgi:hypothetical protein
MMMGREARLIVPGSHVGDGPGVWVGRFVSVAVTVGPTVGVRVRVGVTVGVRVRVGEGPAVAVRVLV